MRNFAALHDAACPEPPQLPAELWAYIFQQLTMKDWACAASTCRALWAVQPYPAGMCRICLDDTCWPGMQKVTKANLLTFLAHRGSKGALLANVQVDGNGSASLPWVMYSSMPFASPEALFEGKDFMPFLAGVVQDLLAPACTHSGGALEGHIESMRVLPLFQGLHTVPFVWLDVVKGGDALFNPSAPAFPVDRRFLA